MAWSSVSRLSPCQRLAAVAVVDVQEACNIRRWRIFCNRQRRRAADKRWRGVDRIAYISNRNIFKSQIFITDTAVVFIFINYFYRSDAADVPCPARK
ncbi:hypothetical protein SDC9_207631 [bioreactor metagenome]|uniref:Uncharacterized protein n=1 Tax=bioreactor metagenome TaxID=1076179 RepID=A0A645JB00_9ZZZZ